jgi:tRNA (cmo5U34)-methyltransferase
MTGFIDSRWSDAAFSQGYRESADDYIPERWKLVEMIQFLYRHFMNGRNGNSVLDLGCGDGLFVQQLLRIDPDIEATLVDASVDMLAAARHRLSGHERANFVQASFQDILFDDLLGRSFDFILSSLAIHHLDREQKEALFGYAFSRLKPGGMFVNVDVVRAPTATLEDMYLALWKEWIICNCDPSKGAELPRVPQKYRENPDNKPDSLITQLQALERIGFFNVDCYYKLGIFTIFGGTKDIRKRPKADARIKQESR